MYFEIKKIMCKAETRIHMKYGWKASRKEST
jgi:hypothetical protein